MEHPGLLSGFIKRQNGRDENDLVQVVLMINIKRHQSYELPNL